jgi:hypothetical protein
MPRARMLALLAAWPLAFGPAAVGAQAPAPAKGKPHDDSMIEKTGSAIERGVKAAASGVDRGVQAAAGGAKKAGDAVERGAKAAGSAAQTGAKKIGVPTEPASAPKR